MSVVTVGSEDFDEKVIEKSKDKPVLVDFWADWCQPCKQLGPTLEEVSEEVSDKVTIAKVNVDDSKDKAREYGVRSIPNVKLFVDGNIKDEFVGAMPKEDIIEWIDDKV